MEHVNHILIVDDDREIRELVGNYLKKNGLRTTVVADGRHMRSFLEANTVDLIVLDLMMPGDDGLVLCRELRAGKHKATPILMLTARNDETDRILGLEMGADDYLTKPFAFDELLARRDKADGLCQPLDHPQRVLSRDQLLNLTQGRDADLFDRSIDLLVSRLRQRLMDDSRESTYIKTVRSEGYVFSYPVEMLGAQS